jgi:uncharacterized iron-regulated protein
VFTAAALSAQSTNNSQPVTANSYTPHRVYDTDRKKFIDFEEFVARLVKADLVFVGEQHDDPGTHRLELAILEGIARRRDSVVLALEMFERDVQPLLDGYVSRAVTEDSLLSGGRPWKNYREDYRPLVELARQKGWPVVASNVPRPLASMVARAGLGGLDTLMADRRATAATDLQCPEDEYYKRFVKEMGDLSGHGPNNKPEDVKAAVNRMYLAQCVKDETMGESIARAFRPGRLVIHYNGSFHSDFGLGTATRAERRLGKVKTLVVTAVPVKDLDDLKVKKEERR